MPECNICRSPYVEGQAFCKSCGARFTLEQPDRGFCSRCGTKLLLHQEKCPECGVFLKPRPADYLSAELIPRQQPPPAKSRLFWYGLLSGFALLIAIALGWFFVKGTPSNVIARTEGKGKQLSVSTPPVQGVLQPELQGPGTAPPEPDANAVLRSQLEALLVIIKEANQNKDLDAFLSVYSPNFPHLAQKKRSTRRIWRKYDFPNLKFNIEEAELLAPDRAFAKVSWDIESKNRWTQKITNDTITYRVWFIKEPVQWRIQTLEKESQTKTGNGSQEIVGKKF